MPSAVLRRAATWVGNLGPFVTCALLALLTVVPLPLVGWGRVSPALPLIAVYYWSIHRPDLLPGFAVFAVGLLVDVLGGGVLGANAMLLLIVRGAIAHQRRFFIGKSFLVHWWAFGLVAAAVLLFGWLLAMLLNTALLAPLPVLVRLGLTLMFYPAVAAVLIAAQRGLPQQA